MRRNRLLRFLLLSLIAVVVGSALTPTEADAARRRTRRAKQPPPPGGVYARHAVAIDPATGQTLFAKDPARAVPIASITKLMSIMVFLEQHPDLDRVAEVAREDRRGAGRTQLLVKEKVRLEDLLHMSLMVSDNCATRTLSRSCGLEPTEFIARMNQRAVELGLKRTEFVEVTGLDERNVSTAVEVARLLQVATDHPLMRNIMTKQSYHFVSGSRRSHDLRNTNRLVYGSYDILGGKTGHIGAAGFCLATWLRHNGRDLIAVVLGAPNSPTRFNDVRRIVQRVETTRSLPMGR